MVDFFIPDGNENELERHAKHLGIKEYAFLYDFANFQTKKATGDNKKSNKENNNENCKESKENLHQNTRKESAKTGVIIRKPTLKEVAKALRTKNCDFVVVKYTDSIRTILEKSRGLYIYGCEEIRRKDHIHYRNSGLNHVLAAIACKNKINFVFNFSDFLDLDRFSKSISLGRLKQNIMLYRKYKVGFSISSFASDKYQIKKDLSIFQKLLESSEKFLHKNI